MFAPPKNGNAGLTAHYLDLDLAFVSYLDVHTRVNAMLLCNSTVAHTKHLTSARLAH